MSGYNNNYSDEFDSYDEAGSQGGGGLRRQLEEVLAENKKLLARLDKQDREKSTSSLLSEKGLDPAIAELIPEGTDPAAWVEKYAHLLGVPQNTPNEEPAAEPEAQLADDSDPALVARREELAEEAEALAQMQEAAESGQPTTAVAPDWQERLDKIQSEDELMKFFRTNGAVGG